MENSGKVALIETQVEGRIGYITLNRPERRNALSYALVSQLKEAFTAWQGDPGVRVVVLRAKAPCLLCWS